MIRLPPKRTQHYFGFWDPSWSFCSLLVGSFGPPWPSYADLNVLRMHSQMKVCVLLRLNLLKDKTNLRSTFCCSAQILVPILPLQFWMILATARTASWWRISHQIVAACRLCQFCEIHGSRSKAMVNPREMLQWHTVGFH